MNSFPRIIILACLLFLVTVPFGKSQQLEAQRLDNGTMWTFDHPPVEYFKERYGFSPSQSWLDETRLGALRFGGGCSASFISDNGLVMTNYHCAIDAVTTVTGEGEDLLRDGFVAYSLEDERKVEGLFVEQLVEIHDVTAEVQNAMEGKLGDELPRARDEATRAIQERMSVNGLRCQVVRLYHGGLYSAYLYKRYDDVRLVFSSERAFAFFGGVHDFWAYPRYSFDCNLFRVYGEDGEPFKTPHYFKWSREGARPEEPVFVVGNPGRTGRLVSVEMVEFDRDLRVPFTWRILTDRKSILEQWLENNKDQHDAAYFDEIFGINNAQEIYEGRLAGLRDDELIERRREFDETFKAAVRADPELNSRYGDMWKNIAELVKSQRKITSDLYALRSSGLGVAEHVSRAAAIVQWVRHMEMPEHERPNAWKGESADRMRTQLATPLETDPVIEGLTLERQLSLMLDMLGKNDRIMRGILQNDYPEQAAARMLSTTLLSDEQSLSALLDGGMKALRTSDDAFIRFALSIQARAEAASAKQREISLALDMQRERMGRALFDVYGTSFPPDATFTLRISDGVVRGYDYNGTVAPPFTTFFGMYDRYHSFRDSETAFDAMMSGNAFDLPPRWKSPASSFNLSTPFNFVSTADIIGGNSGSPVINTRREVVGLAFDGNFESLSGEFIYAEDKGKRAISVHSSGILEALRHVYKAERIVQEIENAR